MFSNWVSKGVQTGAAGMVQTSVRATKILPWRHKEARLGVWASSATSPSPSTFLGPISRCHLHIGCMGNHCHLESHLPSTLPYFSICPPSWWFFCLPDGWAFFGSLHSSSFRHPPWGPSTSLALSQPSHLECLDWCFGVEVRCEGSRSSF